MVICRWSHSRTPLGRPATRRPMTGSRSPSPDLSQGFVKSAFIPHRGKDDLDYG